MLQPGDGTGRPMGANRATGNDDLLRTWMGIGSQIDGLGHMGTEHRYYNGLKAEDFVRARGLEKLGTHAIPPIVTRGVLLDMTAHYDADPVPAGTAFGPEAIEAAARAQGVTLEEADVVLFHTGWQALAETDVERFMTGEPGLGVAGARHLAEIGVVAVGADTWAVEALPHEDPEQVFPVHVELLARNGIYILENMNTAELAADEGWTFLFVLGQPRFEGAVQAVINPVAIR
ncbi:MAG: cyclase family protein [Gammaproteobacteria bacterium]|nr:cyclase family protein [Gammaproteobacteria bacterium]